MDLRFIYFSLLVAAASGNSFAAEKGVTVAAVAPFEGFTRLSAEKSRRVQVAQLVTGEKQLVGAQNPALPLLGWRNSDSPSEVGPAPKPAGAISAGGLHYPGARGEGEHFSIVAGGTVEQLEQVSSSVPLRAHEKLPASLFSDSVAAGQNVDPAKPIITSGEVEVASVPMTTTLAAVEPAAPKTGTFSIVPDEVVMKLDPDVAFAADWGVSGTTLVGLESRSVPGIGTQQLMPVTQFLKLDLDKLNSEKLSFHLYGWGRGDLADKSTPGDRSDADIAYGYLRYRLAQGNGEIKAGRFALFDGGIVEQLNGVAFRGDLLKDGVVSLSLFGGSPVKPPTADNRGNLLLGGRTSYRIPGKFEGGLYFVHESGLNNGPDTDLKRTRQLVGADLTLTPFSTVELTGHSTYNASTSAVAEHSYLLSVRPTPSLLVGMEYSLNNLKDYFSSSAIRSLFNPNQTERFAAYGTKVTYTISTPLELSLDLKDFQRDTRADSYLYGAELRLNLPELKTKYGLSWHRLYAGKFNGFENLPITSYNEVRGYALYNYEKLSASLDLMADIYDSSIDGKRISYLGVASVGYAFTPSIALSGDLVYEANPVVGSEIRALLKLIFNYSASNFTRSTKGVGK